MRHLGEALDTVRKSEYGRLSGRDRRYIKGQKYTLLSRRENLTLDGKKALKALLANKRLNTAYLLKESFGQLWDYEREAWARRFFENWRSSLKWQRLKPYEKFAAMIERHWDGIAAYCQPENKVSLGFVEGLNNKIRLIQRRAYGLKRVFPPQSPDLHAAGTIADRSPDTIDHAVVLAAVKDAARDWPENGPSLRPLCAPASRACGSGRKDGADRTKGWDRTKQRKPGQITHSIPRRGILFLRPAWARRRCCRKA